MELEVLKIGGSEIDDPARLRRFSAALASVRVPAVVVHGGGIEIDRMQRRLGFVPTSIEGQRVTDADTMALVEMVLSGSVNKRLARALGEEGVPALGLAGTDLRLLRCLPGSPALGMVGEPSAVNAAALRALLEQGLVPVLSPVALGPCGRAFNVNADHAARAFAAAFPGARLSFVTNVPGVRVGNALRARLDRGDALAAIESGEISGGMIPKVRAALAALERGVEHVRICDLDGLREGGTTFTSGAPGAQAKEAGLGQHGYARSV